MNGVVHRLCTRGIQGVCPSHSVPRVVAEVVDRAELRGPDVSIGSVHLVHTPRRSGYAANTILTRILLTRYGAMCKCILHMAGRLVSGSVRDINESIQQPEGASASRPPGGWSGFQASCCDPKDCMSTAFVSLENCPGPFCCLQRGGVGALHSPLTHRRLPGEGGGTVRYRKLAVIGGCASWDLGLAGYC
jgi:hypothetical protein